MSIRNIQIYVFMATSLFLSQWAMAHFPGTSPLKFTVREPSKARNLRDVIGKGKRAVKGFGQNLSRAIGQSKWPSKVLRPLDPLQESARYRFLKFNDKIASKLLPKLKQTYNALRDANPVAALSFIGKKLLKDPLTKGYGYGTIGFSKALQISAVLGFIDPLVAAKIQGYNLLVDGAVLCSRTLQVQGFKGLWKLLGPNVVKHNRTHREVLRWYGDVFIKPMDNNRLKKDDRGPITPSM